MTKYADAILDVINSSYDHLSAEQVFLKLKEAMPGVSLATVYNNLNTLCTNHCIRRVTMENGPDRFDRVERHDHLICERCGALSDFTFPDLTEILQKQMSEPLLSYDLKVKYVCPQCRSKGA